MNARYVLLVLVVVGVVVAALLLGPWFRNAPRQLTQAQPEVKISYSWRYTDTIGVVHPSGGSMFLVVSLTIVNRGYNNFTADPFSNMFVLVHSVSYNVSSVYIFLGNPFQPSTLQNGGSASGEVAFEVSGAGPPSPGWRLPVGVVFRITWAQT